MFGLLALLTPAVRGEGPCWGGEVGQRTTLIMVWREGLQLAEMHPVSDLLTNGGVAMKFKCLTGAFLAPAVFLIFSAAAQAQTTSASSGGPGSSGRMWGSASVPGATTDSSTVHTQDGNAAGQVNAARRGLLLNGGPGMTITAIGSQNIVSTTITGNNNTTNVNATQSASNTGSVSNNGSINFSQQ